MTFPGQLKADELVLKDGTAIKEVKITKLTGKSVLYRNRDGSEQTISYSSLSDIRYAPIKKSPRPQKPRIPESKMTPGDAFNVLEKRWADLENQREELEKQSASVESKIVALSSSSNTALLAENDDRESLNAALRERDALEERLQVVINEERTIVNNMTQLARTMRILPDTNDTKDNENHADYLWRSAILPGWGQYQEDRRIESYTLFTASALLGLYALRSYRSYQDFESARIRNLRFGYYSDIGGNSNFALAFALRAKDYQRRVNRQRENFNFALGLLTGLYALNLADAYYAGGLFNLSSINQKEPNTSIVGVSYTITF